MTLLITIAISLFWVLRLLFEFKLPQPFWSRFFLWAFKWMRISFFTLPYFDSIFIIKSIETIITSYTIILKNSCLWEVDLFFYSFLPGDTQLSVSIWDRPVKYFPASILLNRARLMSPFLRSPSSSEEWVLFSTMKLDNLCSCAISNIIWQVQINLECFVAFSALHLLSLYP